MADINNNFQLTLPESISNILNQTVGSLGYAFTDCIIKKTFGKSAEQLKTENEIAAKTHQLKHDVAIPFILQAEQEKLQREYSNLGQTLKKAQPLIKEKKKIEDDNDFFWGAIEHAKTVSNDKVQDLIAKIIAGEYNNPESHSPCTLQVLKNLGKNELELFEKICTLLLDNYFLLSDLCDIDKYKNKINEIFSIEFHFTKLMHLTGLGLFLPNKAYIQADENKNYKFQYFSQTLTYQKKKQQLLPHKTISAYLLSSAGLDIAQHLNYKYNDAYFQWFKKEYIIPNYKLISNS